MAANRVLLVDPDQARRDARARRLRAQGYAVQEATEGALGAEEALASPPDAIVAELWMPSVSGVQLCRLVRAEPATCDVPVILCGGEEPRSRFWAERAGAAAYIVNGRTGELVRALERAIASRPGGGDGFFTQLAGGTTGVRDRIAKQLDEALFESVIAAEVRALASLGSFERLFDKLAQLMSQLTRYRYLALGCGDHVSVHHHPSAKESVDVARAVLKVDPAVAVDALVDDDAVDCACDGEPLVRSVAFADQNVATIALCPCGEGAAEAEAILGVVARELGGAIKIASLMEATQRAATTDPLTGLANRRGFAEWLSVEVLRVHRYGHPLTLVMIDIDHFKAINDRHGHEGGDGVLVALGALLRDIGRKTDLAARWGGEEFVMAYTDTPAAGGMIVAERLRQAIEGMRVSHGGFAIPVTASLGVAELGRTESSAVLLEHADAAMYISKTSGRNRVTLASSTPPAASLTA